MLWVGDDDDDRGVWVTASVNGVQPTLWRSNSTSDSRDRLSSMVECLFVESHCVNIDLDIERRRLRRWDGVDIINAVVRAFCVF